MALSKRISGFLQRFLRGEDAVLVPQTKEQWERQFADGTWNRLQRGQSNTVELARLILDCAWTKKERIHVLDVGCGNGGLARLIAHAVDYIGIDIAESAIASARKAVPYGTFIVCDAMYPLKDLGVFDILVFNELLYYLDPRIVLPRYRIHTNAGAQIYISIIRFWRSWFLWRRIRQKLQLSKQFIVKDTSHSWDIAMCAYV